MTFSSKWMSIGAEISSSWLSSRYSVSVTGRNFISIDVDWEFGEILKIHDGNLSWFMNLQRAKKYSIWTEILVYGRRVYSRIGQNWKPSSIGSDFDVKTECRSLSFSLTSDFADIWVVSACGFWMSTVVVAGSPDADFIWIAVICWANCWFARFSISIVRFKMNFDCCCNWMAAARHSRASALSAMSWAFRSSCSSWKIESLNIKTNEKRF